MLPSDSNRAFVAFTEDQRIKANHQNKNTQSFLISLLSDIYATNTEKRARALYFLGKWLIKGGSPLPKSQKDAVTLLELAQATTADRSFKAEISYRLGLLYTFGMPEVRNRDHALHYLIDYIEQLKKIEQPKEHINLPLKIEVLSHITQLYADSKKPEDQKLAKDYSDQHEQLQKEQDDMSSSNGVSST